MEVTLYFELYGKKMKTVIVCKDVDVAKAIVKEKIIWHKVETKPEKPPPKNPFGGKNPFDGFDDIFGKDMFGDFFGKKK